ncbi:MAG: hypothetical protein K2Y30_16065 [Flavobacteriaceae bacterium]|nr:hypothetical protein [Flavobacteriaceae bacterium]
MKSYILSIILFAFTHCISAQNAMADLRFEEAELAYNKGENTTAITKLDELDTLLGSVTAKSLYLRIVTQKAILDRRVNYRTFGFNYTTITGAALKDPVTILKPFKDGISPELREFDLLLSVDGIDVNCIKDFVELLKGKFGEEYDGGEYADLIVKRNNIAEPIKVRAKLLGGFYSNEDNYEQLASLRKYVHAYLKAMESEDLDDKFREVYSISEKLKKYPIDKKEWLKKKQYLETQSLAKIEEEKSKEEELDKYYRGIAPKIDAWEWSEGIQIGGNFEQLKSQYPELFKSLKKHPFLKNQYASKVSKTETLESLGLDYPDRSKISYYSVLIYLSKSDDSNKKQTEMKTEMDKLKQKFKTTFGDSLIFEKDNEVIFTISSPYSNYKIEVQNDYFSIKLVKAKK